jgi:hypothetical protein
MSPDGVRHTGPVYAGQSTLTTIQELVDNWWEGRGRRLEFADRQSPVPTANEVAASPYLTMNGPSGTEQIATA